jgi:hypothetical protein
MSLIHKFFNRLNAHDYEKDKLLSEFYKLNKKYDTHLSVSYISYITRNMDYQPCEKEEKIKCITEDVNNSLMELIKDNKINKNEGIIVLSEFIKQSFMNIKDIHLDDMEYNQELHEKNISFILNEIKSEGRNLPKPKTNQIFQQRNKLMEIMNDTYVRCEQLQKTHKELVEYISKVCIINIDDFKSTKTIQNPININSMDIEINNTNPLCMIYQNNNKNIQNIKKLKTKNKCKVSVLNKKPSYSSITDNQIYICSGSCFTNGGNAEQGIYNKESDLYLNSTYSITFNNSSILYPILNNYVLLCPNVIFFKSSEYKILDIKKWYKISVLINPAPFRPIKDLDIYSDSSIGDLKYAFLDKIYSCIDICDALIYDEIILDDFGAEENQIPIVDILYIYNSIIKKYKNNFKYINICVENQKIYSIIKNNIK